MISFPKTTFFLCCLALLAGCDQIYMRRVDIDFQRLTPMTFKVSQPGDFDALFSRIGAIATKHGLSCRFNEAGKTSYVCTQGTVSLAVRVTAEKSVTVSLTQFGPWRKTAQFSMLEKDLSAFLSAEFPGQQLQLAK